MILTKAMTELPSTIRLFREDAYLKACEAKVLYVYEDLVVTDKSVFYAESGGQVADTGYINSTRIIDVQKTAGRRQVTIRPEDNRFGIEVPFLHVETLQVHRCEGEAAFKVGQSVSMKIDWNERYLNMRCHTAAHFVFHAVREVYGAEGEVPTTKGCFIKSDRARFDFVGKLDGDRMAEVERVANELVERDENIRMETDAMTNEVAYWVYGNDEIVIPCGGTHCRRASEVGPISLRRKSHGKGLTRVYATIEEAR